MNLPQTKYIMNRYMYLCVSDLQWGNAITRNINGSKFVPIVEVAIMFKQTTFPAVRNFGGLELNIFWKENTELSCKRSSAFLGTDGVVDLQP
jgi:hypothetical protein